MLAGGLGHAVDRRGEADLVAGFLLVGDIRHAGTVGAHDYGCQMRCAVALFIQVAHFVGYFIFDLQGGSLAV